ncbi:MAG: leucine-rich repeat domain-containing protein, partial [Clostridia bacterium]|nr:leucine-rich repeat domain-containing protein [Clostridia bacterium]
MKKIALALLFLLSVLALLVSCQSDGTSDENGLEYQLNADGSGYTVVGIGNCTATEVVIPKTYKGLPVVEIGREAFSFYKLTSVKIPGSVKKIGDRAFAECSMLNEVILSKGLTEIGVYAFYRCSALSEIVVPDSVKTVERNAFSNCTSLAGVTLGKGVEEIELYAFLDCGALATLTVDPDNRVYRSEGNCLIEQRSSSLVLGCKTSEI